MEKDLISWKTDAWKNPDMVAWYHKRMVEDSGTMQLKNQVELELCRQYAVGHKLLDVGIGTGRASLPFARDGYDLTGVDSSQAMLDQCAALAGDTPVQLLQRDLADLGFPNQAFDTLISLNVMVHFPNWRDVLAEWRRVVRPEGRIIFDIHSRDHDLATSSALGLPTPPEQSSPVNYTSRIGASELVEAVNAHGLSIVAVVPYAGMLISGSVNHWLHSSLASGARYERLLSWLSSDPRLYRFSLFLEQEVFGALTPKATERMMIVLDNRPNEAANKAWLANCMAVDEALSRTPLRFVDVAPLIPSWTEDWRAQLNAHLEWPRNRALLHFLLSNFPGRIDLGSFLDEHHAVALSDWQQRHVIDLLTSRSLRRFITEPGFNDVFQYKGVNLREGVEYELTREMLTHYFKAFPQA